MVYMVVFSVGHACRFRSEPSLPLRIACDQLVLMKEDLPPVIWHSSILLSWANWDGQSTNYVEHLGN